MLFFYSFGSNNLLNYDIQHNCKAQPCRASLGYPFHNMAAHMEATPTREGIQANAHLALAQDDL